MKLPFRQGPVAFCEFVEGQLGWEPDPTKERWKALMTEAGKLKRKRATNPELYSWENLALTVEWLRRRHHVVSTPTSVCWKVEAALKASATPVTPVVVVDVAKEIVAAIEWEQTQDRMGKAHWIHALTRAAGSGRADVLAEWRRARL